jgi:hypothetical protein
MEAPVLCQGESGSGASLGVPARIPRVRPEDKV